MTFNGVSELLRTRTAPMDFVVMLASSEKSPFCIEKPIKEIIEQWNKGIWSMVEAMKGVQMKFERKSQKISFFCLGAIQKWQLLLQHLWLVLSGKVSGAQLLNILFEMLASESFLMFSMIP